MEFSEQATIISFISFIQFLFVMETQFALYEVRTEFPNRLLRHWGRFSPGTSVSPANSHSTDCSTLINHSGLVQ
jgi:hypothetical protein